MVALKRLAAVRFRPWPPENQQLTGLPKPSFIPFHSKNSGLPRCASGVNPGEEGSGVRPHHIPGLARAQRCGPSRPGFLIGRPNCEEGNAPRALVHRRQDPARERRGFRSLSQGVWVAAPLQPTSALPCVFSGRHDGTPCTSSAVHLRSGCGSDPSGTHPEASRRGRPSTPCPLLRVWLSPP